MAGDTVITVVGNLTADPDFKYTPSGAAVANFTIASTPRSFDKQTNEWKDGEPLFMRCAAWKQLAENVAESLTKGCGVIAQGRLKQRSYEKDGQTRTVIELEVDEIGPTLKWATAKVTRANRGSGGGRRTAQPAQQAPADDPWANGGGQQGGWGSPATSADQDPPF